MNHTHTTPVIVKHSVKDLPYGSLVDYMNEHLPERVRAYLTAITPRDLAEWLPSMRVQHDGEHYKHMTIQPALFTQLNGMPSLEAQVIHYVSRHRQKHGAADLKKAMHMLQMIIEMEYGPDA